MSNLERSIWCWVLGDKPPHQRVFLVNISLEATVSELRDTIKEKRRPVFDHIAADQLDLYKTSILAESDLDNELNNIGPDSLENELLPMHKLSQSLPDPTDGYRQIIVVHLPGAGK
jgi:Crinkler effector protein N-terminal domain